MTFYFTKIEVTEIPEPPREPFRWYAAGKKWWNYWD